MKRNIIFVFCVLVVCFSSCSFFPKKFDNPQKQVLLMELINYVLEKGHYSGNPIDDAYSKRVYKQYMMYLDGQKRFFLQSDMDDFEYFHTRMDDDLRNGDLTFFELSQKRLKTRMNEASLLYKEILSQPFNFDLNESLQTDYEKIPYVQNKKDLKERWRKRLKFSVLSSYVIKQKEEQSKKEKDPKYTPKPDEELLKEATQSIEKNLDDMFLMYNDFSQEDWFGMFLNSYMAGFDPHSDYFSPNLKERFDRSMAGRFEGIGAQLQKKVEGVRVADVIIGGPVWKGKLLEVGDYILKVGEPGKDPVDIVGMRLDDAIKLIKGKKGTEVRLTVKRVDGTIEEVAIVRDVVELEETYAKTALVKGKNHTYGVINLPSFYMDPDDTKKNAANDIEQELTKLKQSNAEGLVLDLRNNGGGSLGAVVKIAGFFIKNGPIVQVNRKDGLLRSLDDTDSRIQWNKPLVILVNELSASASEILAAAMQDYHRAVILGSKQTFGKGTVQTIINLDQMVRNNNLGEVGAAKLTVEKFYRVNGGSTQLEGVKSDIIAPDKYKYIDVGERELDYPLPWDKVQAANYQPLPNNFSKVIAQSQKRILANSYFALIEDNAKWVKQQEDDDSYTLNYQQYKKQLQENEEANKKYKPLKDYKSGLKIFSLPSEEKLVLTNEDVKIRRDRWHESLQQDLYLDEAVHVLDDLLAKP